jgi:hypothetical protein
MRLKKNIRPFLDALQTIEKINPILFNWNGLAGYADDGNDVVGVLANDIQPFMPYAVGAAPAKLQVDGVESDLLSFDVNAVTFTLVNAVKELKKYVNSLDKRIEILETHKIN